MWFQIDHGGTANGHLMRDRQLTFEAARGIERMSDTILEPQTSLYRVATAKRWNRNTGRSTPAEPEGGRESPWWTTLDYFQVALNGATPETSAQAAQAAFAIHPEWRSDCSQYVSIATRVRLSAWYGLGRSIRAIDPASRAMTILTPSPDILQLYIPGFPANAAAWSRYFKVLPFMRGVRNPRGFQGNLPRGLR